MHRQPWRVVVTDGTGVRRTGLLQIQPGTADAGRARSCWCPGKIELFSGRRTIPHPEHVVPADRPDLLPAIEPIWPLTGGLWPRQVASAMAQALARLPSLAGVARSRRCCGAKNGRRSWRHCARCRRRPRCRQMRSGLAWPTTNCWPTRSRSRVVRGRLRARPGRSLTGDGTLRAKALSRFGYTLTGSQQQALAEIDADLASERRMLRLLQGDVGSGKTMVALLAMLRAVEAGKQAAMMAPTEVLAKQHHRTLSRLSPAPVALLTGGVKGRARAQLLRGLKDGAVPLVVGTHALFQESVEYRDLALAVIDEQHRFGVDQRLLLGGKGELTDVLVMTATPIPRTLLLTQWGEMEVSRLTEKPPGRRAVRTSLHSLGTLPDLLDAVARKLDEGAQVYWVCPLVAESEALDLAAAEERFAVLRERFGDVVGLAHGRQDAAVRDATLAAFAAGGCRLLVATTVVEVGVDVPQATVMVIEHAERFGLAQLAPVARAGGARCGGELLSAAARGVGKRRGQASADAAARYRRRVPDRGRGFSPARRRRYSGNEAVRVCPDSGWPIRSSTKACCTWRTVTQPHCCEGTRSLRRNGDVRCECCFGCSRKRRRCGRSRQDELGR